MQTVDTALVERDRLVRFCAAYTADPVIAEDLTQRTLLAAWRHEQQLRDPQARQAWLFSIAHRECQNWLRQQSRARLVGLEALDETENAARLADNFDVEVELERDELARLLDRAMAMLSPQLRDVLVRRYIEEAPQAQIASQLGVSEGAVEARLQRGKLALRRVLSTEFSDEAVALGLIGSEMAGWVETRVWCPGCGRRHLEGLARPSAGTLFMRCPECSYAEDSNGELHFIHAQGSYLKQMQSFKPGVSRVLDDIHDMYRVQAHGGMTPCPRCGQMVPFRRGAPPWQPRQQQHAEGSVFVMHQGCGVFDWESWHSLTWSLPAVRRFWKEHQRMRFLEPREVEHAGSPAVVTGFASLSAEERIEVVALRDTLEVVHVAASEGKDGNG